MISWKTFGHERIKNIFNKQLEANTLAHAYLFAGSQGVGKKTLALELAKEILGTENLSNHPDFQILDGDGEISAEIAVDFIRGLSLKPFVASKKVAVINNAQNLNQQSSNALLKTLEEPASNTIIILISGSGKLLPTIVSRCQVFNFYNFSKEGLEKFSLASEIKTSNEILELSFGRIDRLMQLSKDPAFLTQQLHTIQKYEQFSKMPTGEKFLAISEYAEFEADELQKDFSTWMSWQMQSLNKNPKNVSKLQALTDAINGLKFNQNKKLVLQGLFLKL
jgi:DNA polymerase-3 subunit delta'